MNFQYRPDKNNSAMYQNTNYFVTKYPFKKKENVLHGN